VGIRREHIEKDSVETEDVVAKAIGAGKLNYFLSDEQTGTGSTVSIPHDLGVAPTLVIPFITGDARSAWGTVSITVEGADASYLYITATADVKYRVLAIA